jgi:hypothetical protein
MTLLSQKVESFVTNLTTTLEQSILDMRVSRYHITLCIIMADYTDSFTIFVLLLMLWESQIQFNSNLYFLFIDMHLKIIIY